MDFLDNAVSKAKEVFDVAYKKTEVAVNTGKQKFDLASMENKLSKDYEKLGIIYYNTIKDADVSDEKIKELKIAIEEKLEKIEKIKADINEVKNKRFCPECGVAIDKNAAFCSSCGAKLEFED